MIEGESPSRFLFEVPEECLDGSIETQGQDGYAPGELDGVPFTPRRRSGSGPAERAPKREFEDYSQEEVGYSVGTRIIHNDFGRGIVRKVEGSGENLRVTVLFDNGSERKFLAHYAPMRPLA